MGVSPRFPKPYVPKLQLSLPAGLNSGAAPLLCQMSINFTFVICKAYILSTYMGSNFPFRPRDIMGFTLPLNLDVSHCSLCELINASQLIRSAFSKSFGSANCPFLLLFLWNKLSSMPFQWTDLPGEHKWCPIPNYKTISGVSQGSVIDCVLNVTCFNGFTDRLTIVSLPYSYLNNLSRWLLVGYSPKILRGLCKMILMPTAELQPYQKLASPQSFC